MSDISKDRIKRSEDMLIIGYYLSRCGKKIVDHPDGPPEILGVSTWNEAYDVFFDFMNDGRDPASFRNSMKNARDTFDHLFNNGRKGWINQDGERPSIRNNFKLVHDEWKHKSDYELQSFVLALQSGNSSSYTGSPDLSVVATEGGLKVFASRRRERNRKIREAAIAIHGVVCMGCNFSFEQNYGSIGKDFIEVHHVVPLSEAGKSETNPSTDLVVLCANCHRMVHRRRGICLSITELKSHIISER